MKYLCNDCPRRCGAVRTEKENIGGFCMAPYYPKIARADLHFWEEPCISGENGSGTIFFSGCNLRCVYCQNYEISHKNGGEIVTPEALAEKMRMLEKRGAHNINFVNPSHYIAAIEEALKIYKPAIPLVMNSSGYDLAEIIEKDIFDIYLFDLKYTDSDKSLRYSGVENYFVIAEKAIKAAYKLKGKAVFNENGIMQSGVIIRHLILPLNTATAIKVADWVEQNTPEAYFSLMAQYLPKGRAENFKEINRRITKREYDKVVDYICGKNLKNVYLQSLSSAKEDYIPNFNLGD